jgi:hypothetical protein
MPNPIILAGVDLDARASGVIAHAARLAALCQGHLVIAHVVDDQTGDEDDHGCPPPPGAVLADMVRHARASLLGMVYHQDLPTDWAEIQVQTGPVRNTLVDLAVARHSRYVLIGSARWGLLSPTAGLADALKIRNAGQLLVVPGTDEAAPQGLMSRVRRWLGLDLAVQPGPGR